MKYAEFPAETRVRPKTGLANYRASHSRPFCFAVYAIRSKKVVVPVHLLGRRACAVDRVVQLSTILKASPLSQYSPSVMRVLVSAWTVGAPSTRSGVKRHALARLCCRIALPSSLTHLSSSPLSTVIVENFTSEGIISARVSCSVCPVFSACFMMSCAGRYLVRRSAGLSTPATFCAVRSPLGSCPGSRGTAP